MIKQKEIMEVINRLLVHQFPSYTVYIQECPKDFTRPSFLLEYVRVSQRDVNRNTVEKAVYITITCYSPVDKHYRSDMDELSVLQDKVIELLAAGSLQVGSRHIKIKSSSGGMDSDRAFIDAQFDYFDNRYSDESSGENVSPIMKFIKTKIEEV